RSTGSPPPPVAEDARDTLHPIDRQANDFGGDRRDSEKEVHGPQGTEPDESPVPQSGPEAAHFSAWHGRRVGRTRRAEAPERTHGGLVERLNFSSILTVIITGENRSDPGYASFLLAVAGAINPSLR